MPKLLDYEHSDVLVAKLCLTVERSPTNSYNDLSYWPIRRQFEVEAMCWS